MLVLTFHIGSERYGLPVDQVAEVLPWVSLRQIPQAPPYVAGLLNYRSVPVPVIDLCRLAGASPTQVIMSSRIIVMKHPAPGAAERMLGLLAERVVSTSQLDPSQLVESGVKLADAPYLGRLVMTQGGATQLVELADLLTPEVESLLFAAAQV